TLAAEAKTTTEAAPPAEVAPVPGTPAAAPAGTLAPASAAPKLTVHPEVIPNPELAAEEAKDNKRYTPFINPKPDCKPPKIEAITADQETKYAELLAYIEKLESIPVSTEKGAESKPIDDEEKMWLTRECLLRYLRATKWNVANAKKRVEGTLTWRREYGVREHTGDYISPELETGKMYTLGFDNDARPCIYLNPGRQNTEKSPRQVHALVYMLERVIDIMGPGQETLALLIDFKSATSSTSPSVGQGREVLNILQMHYPERLGRALIINIPWFVSLFFKAINPFIDPLTREKLIFNEDLRKYVPADQLDIKFGGDSNFEYQNPKYWPEILRIAGERRAAYTARWKELGAKVGTSEVVLRGGKSSVDEVAE
ncbi:CRAL-TRIO domain-containing protein, partial [Morchella snyderi]